MRTAAGVFEAAAASIALIDARRPGSSSTRPPGEPAPTRSSASGCRPATGIAGAAVASGEGVAVADCRSDPRFAARIAQGTGYVPHTMLVVPLERDGAAIGALSVLDRRDGGPYGPADLERAALFADLAVRRSPAEPNEG